MSRTLIVAAGVPDMDRLNLDELEDVFGTDDRTFCDNQGCLKRTIPFASAVVHFSSFPMNFKQTCKLAGGQWNAPPVVHVEYDGCKMFQVQYRKYCSEPLSAEEIPSVIRRYLHAQKEEETRLKPAVLCFTLFLLLASLLCHLLNHTASAETTQDVIEASEK